LALIILLAALVAVPSPAADDATLLKDLTAVIMLLGMPCGQLVSAKRQADNDHIASCENGNHYRVYVNAEGRVVAQQQ
jgi:hypothetical protein